MDRRDTGGQLDEAGYDGKTRTKQLWARSCDSVAEPAAEPLDIPNCMRIVYMHGLADFEGLEMSGEREVIENCACNKVRMAARAVTRAYDSALRPAGLRATQLAVLVAVGMEGAMSITALAEVLGMDRTTLTRNLGPLMRESLIVVTTEGWRRSRAVEITRRGRARVREALPLWDRAQEALKGKLGNRNWVNIRDSLDRLIDAT